MLHALSEQTPRSDSSPALAHLPHISFAPLSAVILSNELDCSRMRGVGARRVRGSREDAERFVEEVRGSDPKLAATCRSRSASSRRAG